MTSGWDSLDIFWAPKLYRHFVDWLYSAIIRASHLLINKKSRKTEENQREATVVDILP